MNMLFRQQHRRGSGTSSQETSLRNTWISFWSQQDITKAMLYHQGQDVTEQGQQTAQPQLAPSTGEFICSGQCCGAGQILTGSGSFGRLRFRLRENIFLWKNVFLKKEDNINFYKWTYYYFTFCNTCYNLTKILRSVVNLPPQNPYVTLQ